jgi:hypothetical protein
VARNSHSAHVNGMNEWMNKWTVLLNGSTRKQFVAPYLNMVQKWQFMTTRHFFWISGIQAKHDTAVWLLPVSTIKIKLL